MNRINEITLVIDLKNPIKDEEIKALFLSICDELAMKLPEKETYFRSLQRECRECLFNIVPNMSDLVRTYLDLLDRETIDSFIKTMGRKG